MGDSGIHNSNPASDSGVFRSHIPIDAEGGIELRQVRPGTVIEVQTRNNTYTVIPQESGETLVWGHPEYCPEPTLIQGLGSAYVTGMIREGYVGPGLRLSFPHMGRRVSTSTILDVRVAKRQ